MAYRDERDAILARVRALTSELETARREVDSLRRRLAGEAEPEVARAATPATQEIVAELASARAILAGLLGEAPEGPQSENSAAVAKPPPLDPAIGPLRRALLTAIVRKFGSVDFRLRRVIEVERDVEVLIERIALAASCTDPDELG